MNHTIYSRKAIKYIMVYFVFFLWFFGEPLTALAATNVQGIITQNTTWTTTNSPYVITSDVTVQAALTINQGVIVKFNEGRQLNIAGGGTLSAAGTSNAYIIFTSIHDDGYGGDTNKNGPATGPEAGDWDCIKFSDNSKGTLKYCVIRYGGSGGQGNVYFSQDNGSTMQYCAVADSKNAGVYIAGSSTPQLAPSGAGHNDFVNNGTFAVRNMSAQDIKAQKNWWGDTKEQAIKQRIFDYYDNNGASGKVDYSQWDTAPNLDFTAPVIDTITVGDNCTINITISDNKAVDLINTTVEVAIVDPAKPAEDITATLNRTNLNDNSMKATVAIGPLPIGCHTYEVVVNAQDQARNSSGEIRKTISNYCCSRVPVCDYIDPAYGKPGETFTVTIFGRDTGFNPDSLVSFSCNDIMVNSQSTTVISPEEIAVDITIAEDAQDTSCDVTVTTGEESVICTNALEIVTEPPCSLSVSPPSVSSGNFLPRFQTATISAENASFNAFSEITIDGFQSWRIRKLGTTQNAVRVLLVVPPRAKISAGAKTVTVISGDQVCTGSLEIIAPD
jgi:hypothetical protein